MPRPRSIAKPVLESIRSPASRRPHRVNAERGQVRCALKDDLRLALAELATPIGFEFADDEKKNADLQFQHTRRELKKLADARAPHRCLLLLDNVDRPGLLDPAQVARLNGGDWLHVLATTRLNAPPHANTTPRIAFFRHLIALLESQPDTPFLGQLKTLLTGQKLTVASDVTVPWDIAYFIEHLGNAECGMRNADFSPPSSRR